MCWRALHQVLSFGIFYVVIKASFSDKCWCCLFPFYAALFCRVASTVGSGCGAALHRLCRWDSSIRAETGGGNSLLVYIQSVAFQPSCRMSCSWENCHEGYLFHVRVVTLKWEEGQPVIKTTCILRAAQTWRFLAWRCRMNQSENEIIVFGFHF